MIFFLKDRLKQCAIIDMLEIQFALAPVTKYIIGQLQF